MATDGLNAFDEETRFFVLYKQGLVRKKPGPRLNPNTKLACDEIVDLRRRRGHIKLGKGSAKAIMIKWGVTQSQVSHEFMRRSKPGKSR